MFLKNEAIARSVTPLQVKRVSVVKNHGSVKSAEVITPMKKIPSEDKDKVQLCDSTL